MSSKASVTKVVTFGAFVEILDGVEGLVHISELAQHHVENPREIIQPGDPVRVKILEIDSERRRLSLSIKRVEGQVLPVRPIVPPAEGDVTNLDDVPELGLSEDVFASSEDAAPAAEAEPEVAVAEEPMAEAEVEAEAPAAAGEPMAEAEVEAEAPAAEEIAPAAEEELHRRPRNDCTGGRGRGASRARCRSGLGARGGGTVCRGGTVCAGRTVRAGGTAGLTIPFVGLTGGIAAGKSTALEALERLGAAVLSTDRVVHELYDDPEVRQAVVERFGPMPPPAGSIDRRAVARIAFATPT